MAPAGSTWRSGRSGGQIRPGSGPCRVGRATGRSTGRSTDQSRKMTPRSWGLSGLDDLEKETEKDGASDCMAHLDAGHLRRATGRATAPSVRSFGFLGQVIGPWSGGLGGRSVWKARDPLRRVVGGSLRFRVKVMSRRCHLLRGDLFWTCFGHVPDETHRGGCTTGDTGSVADRGAF